MPDKLNISTLIFIPIVLLTLAMHAHGVKPATTEHAKAIQISFTADRTTCKPGEEIRFHIELTNRGTRPLRIIMPSGFPGERIHCTNPQGERIPFEGGYLTYSPKAGVYTGRTYLLNPGEKHTAEIDALLDFKYDLVCANQDAAGHNINYKDFKKQANLPADYPEKYLSDGRRFPLEKPGTYKLTYVYAVTANDENWVFSGAKTKAEASTKHLWLGSNQSNAIELTVE